MQKLLQTVQLLRRQIGNVYLSNRFFSSHSIAFDRASHLRRDTKWLEDPTVRREAEYVVYVGLMPVTEFVKSSVADMQISRFLYEEVEHLLVGEENGTLCVFLGLENSRPLFLLGLGKGQDNFVSEPRFVVDGFLMAKPFIDQPLVFYARAILAWNYNHPHCSYCGARTKSVDAGHKRVCTNLSCRSYTSNSYGDHALTHPRSDPATIMCISKGPNLLLVRKKMFPKKLISCVAGFVEPGESLEEAVAREIREEVGLNAASVRYMMSESWPFDSVLMLGCFVTIDENDASVLTMDSDELCFASWFHQDEILLMLEQKHPDWTLPPRKLLANRLIAHWVKEKKKRV